MEFNQPPDSFEGEQKRQTEFESGDAKLAFDAKNLIGIARAQFEKTGVKMNPIAFAHRADDDMEALMAAIAKEQNAVNPAVEATRTQTAEPEAVEVDPRLATFKTDFDKDHAIQAKCSWTEIQSRLLARDGHYLALAQAMEQGGELFGVDAEGNPLISDRGDEPIMKGMNYKDTRDRVLYKHGADNKMITDKDGQPISTGYEMFPYSGDYEKSPEILQYEAHTGKPFIKSTYGQEWRSSWVESGENPPWPRDVYFIPSAAVGYAYVGNVPPLGEFRYRGVRRLLRVKKA